MEILRAEHVSYSYQTKYQKVEAVRDVSCTFEQGNFYAIIGESGSGKSTFLSLLAGLDVPLDALGVETCAQAVAGALRKS